MNNGREIPEGLDQTRLFVGIDNEGTSPLNAASVPHLTLSPSDLAGILDLLNILIGIQILEEGNSLLGLGNIGHGLFGNDEGDLRHLLYSVSSGHHQSREGRSGQS